MKYTNNIKAVALSALLLAGFSGCGDSTTSPVIANAVPASTGYYVDSPVEGVDYNTSSGLSGTTGSDGAFKFNGGDTVTFKIGDLVLRTQSGLTAGGVIQEDKNETITFLQSLDSDGDASNGITLTTATKDAVATWLGSNTALEMNATSNMIKRIEALIPMLSNSAKAVTVNQARLHVEAQKAIRASLEGVADADKIPFGDHSFSPFERVAIFPTVKNADGSVDQNATYQKVAKLATIFAKYVANTDEPATDGAKFKGANWIVGGLDSNTTANDFNDTVVKEHGVLAIPTKLPIDSTTPVNALNTKKVSLVEVCNSEYAGQALGVKNVGGNNGAKVPHGIYHTTALPCEISIYNDDNGIYVDMLNPETIFTTFFTEVFTNPVMENTAFRTAMMALPTQVKNEISALIYNAFDENNETYSKTQIKMGTIYSSMSKAIGTATTPANGGMGAEPYRHYTYEGNGTEYTSTDAKNIAKRIIAVMTSDADGANVGTQEAALKALLPSTKDGKTPLWRSGRLEPLKVPGGSWIIESCSPVYAKEALTTGEYHTPALPCEIAVFVKPDDNKSIEISFLNPEFMFGTLFADGMAKMTQEQIAGFNTIIGNINGDLKTIVDYTMEHNVSGFTGTNIKSTPVMY